MKAKTMPLGSHQITVPRDEYCTPWYELDELAIKTRFAGVVADPSAYVGQSGTLCRRV